MHVLPKEFNYRGESFEWVTLAREMRKKRKINVNDGNKKTDIIYIIIINYIK